MISTPSTDLTLLKAELLCRGIKLSDSALEKIKLTHSYFFDKGFVHAVNMNIGGSNICVSAAEQFCTKSDYVLISDGQKFYLTASGNTIAEAKLFEQLPKTGTVIDAIAKPHSDECISLWPSLSCCYDKPGQKCKFCSIKRGDGESVISEDEIITGLEKLFKRNDGYSLNIGGGTYQNPDRMAQYLARIVEGVRKFTSNPISLELAPPQDLNLIDRLHGAGATSLIINLEICDDNLRAEICPGKHSIPYSRYYETYAHAVKVFGKGKISCVLIVGIQDNADIKKECDKLTDIGVIPTLIPFKPMDDCEFRYKPVTASKDLLDVGEHLSKILKAKGLEPHKQEGCTKCGGCSLETNKFEPKPRT